MGVAIHPKFKLSGVDFLNKDKVEAIRQRMLTELAEMTSHSGSNSDDEDAAPGEDYFRRYRVSSAVQSWCFLFTCF